MALNDVSLVKRNDDSYYYVIRLLSWVISTYTLVLIISAKWKKNNVYLFRESTILHSLVLLIYIPIVISKKVG